MNLSINEKEDLILIFKYFGPMNSNVLANWYSNTFSVGISRRKLSAEEIKKELGVK